MSALFGTGKKTQNAVPASSFNVQTSVAGLPIPIILGGRSRMSINLIGYNDFTAIPHYSSGGGKGSLFAGGSSGGKGNSTTSYTYSVAVAMALGEGGIASVEYVWNDKTKQTLDTLNLSTFTGSATQAAWGYMTSLHPNQALAYRGLAYMAAGPLQLGSSTELPNLSFEVTSTNSYVISGLPDADPSTCITRLLTDPNFGIGFGASRIGDLSVYTAYCRATGMLVSPTITDLTSGQDFIKTLLEATNSEAVWSQGQLRIVPRGDQAVTAGTMIQVTETHTIVPDFPTALSYPGTFGSLISIKNSADGGVYQRAASPNYIPGGYYYPVAPDQFAFAGGTAGTSISITYTYYEPATYTPPTQPVYALGDDDYAIGSSGASQPVDITRSAPQDQKNSVVVNFLDRTSAYNLTPTPAAKDDAAIQMYGLRQDSVRDYHFFCYAQAAQQSAQLLLGRNLVRNTYTFTLGQKYVLLDPMDIVSLTDSAAGLVAKWVRITEITENDDLTLTMTAEEYLAGSSAAPLYGQEPNAGYVPNYNQDPGFINAPVIFEPPSTLTDGANELWVGVSGGSTVYGGCDTYVSYDDANYALVPDAHLVGSARTGYLTAALPAGAALDTTNTLAVDISQVPGAQLTSGTMADATNFATLCYVDGELIAYQTATLTALGHYTLGTLVRGCYGTPITAHAAGKPFVRLDMQIVKIPFNKALVNSTIFLKFVPFNLWGQGGQGISAVSPIAYTFGGGQAPGLIVFSSVQFTQSGLAATLVAKWGIDGLSASYQSQISQDNGATWTSVLQNTDTTLRVDGLKAVATIVRVRGVTSSGVIGVWASATLGAPALTSAGSGYSQIISYKDLNPSIVDNMLGSTLEVDNNDLASFVSAVQSNTKATAATAAANGASAAAVQLANGQVPSLVASFAALTTGIPQQIATLNQGLLAQAAQEAADVLSLGGQITQVKAQFDNSLSLQTGISVVQAGINSSSALSRDDLAVASNLDNDSGELADFVAAVQTGRAAAIQAKASNATNAALVQQSYANATGLASSVLYQMTLAASVQGSLALINNTLTVQSTAATSLAARTSTIESKIGDPMTGLAATYNDVVATQAVTNDPISGNFALSTRITNQSASIASNSSAIGTLQTTSATQGQTLAGLQTTVSANYASNNANISALQSTQTTQGQSISTLQTTVSANFAANTSSIAALQTVVTNNQASTVSSLNTLTANFSGGANDVPNSDLNGSDGYSTSGTSSGGSGSLLSYPNTYANPSTGILLANTGTGQANSTSWDWVTPTISAEAGVTYEFSALAAFQGNAMMQLYPTFLAKDGSLIQYAGPVSGGIGGHTADGGNVANYQRVGGFFTAPAGTVSRRMLLRTISTDGNNAVGFWQHPFTRVSSPGQTVLSPYSPGTQANVPAIMASVATVSAATATNTNSIASLQTTVQSNFNTQGASITSLQGTATSQGSSLSSLQTTVQSNYNTLSGNVSQNSNSIQTLNTQYGSLSSQVSTASAQSAAGTANGQISFVAQSAPSGVTARFGVTLSVSGQQPATGGFALDLTNGVVSFTVAASTFRVEDPNSRFVPFAVSGGQLQLNGVTNILSTVQSTALVNGSPVMSLDFQNGSITIYDAS